MHDFTDAEFRHFIFGLLSGAVLAVLSIIAFAIITDEMLEHEFNALDATISHAFSSLHAPLMDTIMSGFSFWGGTTGTAILLIAALLMLNKNGLLKKHSLMLVISLSGAAGLNQFLKHLFSRPRPIYSLLPDVTGYSFPSGHAMVAAAFFGFMAYLFRRRIPKGPIRLAYYTGFAVFILLIGSSRIYFGVHYFSDIIAGFAAGTFWAAGCAISLHALEYHK